VRRERKVWGQSSWKYQGKKKTSNTPDGGGGRQRGGGGENENKKKKGRRFEQRGLKGKTGRPASDGDRLKRTEKKESSIKEKVTKPLRKIRKHQKKEKTPGGLWEQQRVTAKKRGPKGKKGVPGAQPWKRRFSTRDGTELEKKMGGAIGSNGRAKLNQKLSGGRSAKSAVVVRITREKRKGLNPKGLWEKEGGGREGSM